MWTEVDIQSCGIHDGVQRGQGDKNYRQDE